MRFIHASLGWHWPWQWSTERDTGAIVSMVMYAPQCFHASPLDLLTHSFFLSHSHNHSCNRYVNEGQHDKALVIYLRLPSEAAQVFELIEKYDLYSQVQVSALYLYAADADYW